MKAQPLLANIRVASPCLARWSDMAGDDRARFCGQCQKNVYNISAMTADEASALIRYTEGRLCVRFHQRADGTVMTNDCPEGAAQSRRRKRRFAFTTALGLFLGAGIATLSGTAGEAHGSRGRSRLARTWNDAVWKVKGWLGLQPPPRVLMGDICILPPPAPVPPPSSSAPAK